MRFGPVYAEDVPRYLEQGRRKSDDMRHVRFGLAERLEMAVAWAVPTALVMGGVIAFWRPGWLLPLIALAVFLVYDRIPGPRRVVFGASAAAAATALVALSGGGGAALVMAVVASALLTAVLTYDYTGSTPIEGGSHFEERAWHVALDLERCQGVYSCWEVCPEACFEKREDVRKIELAHDERCVRCGACIVQCPTDALAFETADGRRIEPDVIRRYKLNLLGSRSVDSS